MRNTLITILVLITTCSFADEVYDAKTNIYSSLKEIIVLRQVIKELDRSIEIISVSGNKITADKDELEARKAKNQIIYTKYMSERQQVINKTTKLVSNVNKTSAKYELQEWLIDAKKELKYYSKTGLR